MAAKMLICLECGSKIAVDAVKSSPQPCLFCTDSEMVTTANKIMDVFGYNPKTKMVERQASIVPFVKREDLDTGG